YRCDQHSVPTRRSSDLLDEFRAEKVSLRLAPEPAIGVVDERQRRIRQETADELALCLDHAAVTVFALSRLFLGATAPNRLNEERSEEHTSELQSRSDLV